MDLGVVVVPDLHSLMRTHLVCCGRLENRSPLALFKEAGDVHYLGHPHRERAVPTRQQSEASSHQLGYMAQVEVTLSQLSFAEGPEAGRGMTGTSFVGAYIYA